MLGTYQKGLDIYEMNGMLSGRPVVFRITVKLH